MTSETLPLHLQPGGIQQHLERAMLPFDWSVEFEFAPAGWIAKGGEPRKRDWRAYYIRTPDGKRKRVESVTSICDGILPKDGLPPWYEKHGIIGAFHAYHEGLLHGLMSDDQVVSIVRKNGLGADRARDEAADRGLNVHAILETFMRTGMAPNPAEYPEPHRPFIRGLVKWLFWADPKPIAAEMLVADPERAYAGRMDLIATIGGRRTLVDLKTQPSGQIYEAAHVQVQLYKDAEERWGEHVFDDALIVVVDGSGQFHEMQLMTDSDLARKALDYYSGIKLLTSACESRNRAVRKAAA